ncbi:hypothetical protein DPMN_115590 [Dreissena polymorpha]|uniref:Uncharacterized protein n=1 Tax=Dreissena polymorpha TaxID=45954 RepID=A0A9D4QTH7_DREPO|nr:hypothetical protein DPMN_115590 [Dreissena polymorpha]
MKWMCMSSPSPLVSPDSFLMPDVQVHRSKSSHPLLRQEAVDERKTRVLGTEESNQCSDTKTFKTNIRRR